MLQTVKSLKCEVWGFWQPASYSIHFHMNVYIGTISVRNEL